MMKYLIIMAVLALGALNINARAEPLIKVDKAYALATAKMQKNGAVFMVVKNATDQSDKIIAAHSDIAARTELHTHMMDDGIMMMRAVEHYDLPSHEQITLEPAGHHIMLMGLKTPLKAGENFPLVLTLENAGDIKVDVSIIKPGDAP